MCLFEFKELVIFVAFGVFFHAFCGWAFLLLSYFKFTQIIGNDNEHWWQSITSPRWVPNRWQKETFYNWLSFASHSFCLEKELRGYKKTCRKYPAVTVSSNSRFHLNTNWPFIQCEQLTIEAFIYTCTRTRKHNTHNGRIQITCHSYFIWLFSAIIFANCS